MLPHGLITQHCVILGIDHRAYDKGLYTVYGETLILYVIIKLKRHAFGRNGNNDFVQ